MKQSRAAIEGKREERFRELHEAEERRRRRRLKFLLGQSRLFHHFMEKAGWFKDEEEDEKSSKHMQSPSRRRQTSVSAKEKQDKEDLMDEGGYPVNQVWVTQKSHADNIVAEDDDAVVRLTKQPSVIEFGTMRDYQLEGLNWMINLAKNGNLCNGVCSICRILKCVVAVSPQVSMGFWQMKWALVKRCKPFPY